MELLAPAGSFEALKAAVQSGADAVYIGGSEFSARASAVNFTMDEIKKAADYCHIRNVKLHVAANILIKEKETASFLDYIKELYGLVDAVIIQDIGMADAIRKMYPDLPLHASTQMSVTSASAAKRLSKMGFRRIVLARELSLSAIEKIAKETDAEIEVFAHGAICMCYSGQCLMSSVIGGRSGNRGMCAQPCRLPYTIDGEKGYLLSPKDLCMLEHLGELKRIGVASLKVEGRLKRKEYVSAVCGIYRKYIDNPHRIEKADIDELLAAFNRSGFTDGYFRDKLGREMMSYKNPANISENKFSDWVKEHTKDGCELKKVGINIFARLVRGAPLTVSCWDEDGHFAECSGEILPEAAISKPLTAERLKAQLEKLGGTPFFAESTEVSIDDGITIPVSEINKVRRDLIEKFERVKCERQKMRIMPFERRQIQKQQEKPILVCEVSTLEQAKTAIEHGIREIYAPTPLANKLYKKFPDVKIIAKLPSVMRDDRSYEEPITDSILAGNIGQLDDSKKCYGDFRLNITNSYSKEFYSDLERITLSPELNLKELCAISPGCEIIAYGRIPLMVMENCPLSALGKCQKREGFSVISDRMGEEFLIRCVEGCTAEILNSKPIYMADKPEIVNNLKINALRLIFTVENSAKCGTIIEEYKKMLNGEKGEKLEDNTFTRCHFYRGTD